MFNIFKPYKGSVLTVKTCKDCKYEFYCYVKSSLCCDKCTEKKQLIEEINEIEEMYRRGLGNV